MPAGPEALGFVYFAAVKYAGYSAFCRWGIQPQVEYAASDITFETMPNIPQAWLAGAVRTLIGVAIGTAVGLSFWKIPSFAKHDIFDNGMFFALLVPVRVFEWWLLLKWMYKDVDLPRRTKIAVITAGILVSFALDAAGVAAAFILPGGMWVC